MINLAIIDSDSIAYLGGKDDSLQQILEKVDYKIQEILDETKADYYVLLVSKGKYFRHDISKSKEAPEGSYKANRSYGTQIWVKTIKEYLIAQHKAIWYPQLEADDIAAWLMNQDFGIALSEETIRIEKWEHLLSAQNYLGNDASPAQKYPIEKLNKILVAKDKDLLYSIPGRHLNFSKKLGPEEWGMEWVETSESSANFYEWNALIIGDTSDGITETLKGKGKVFAEKLASSCNTPEEFKMKIFNLYLKEYGTSQGIYNFQKNFRLLHMLSTDEDMLREVGYIPQLPEFQKVIKQEETINSIDF